MLVNFDRFKAWFNGLGLKIIMRDVSKRGRLRPRLWHRLLEGGSGQLRVMGIMRDDARLIYLDMPKAGCTSIKRALLESEAVREKLDQQKRQHLTRLGRPSDGQLFHSTDIWQSVFRRNQYELALRRDLVGIKGLRSRRRAPLYPRKGRARAAAHLHCRGL